MVEKKTHRSSTPLVMGLAALSVVVALLIAFGWGGTEDDSADLSRPDLARAEPAVAQRNALSDSVPQMDRATAPQPADSSPILPSDASSDSRPDRPRDIPPMQEIPQEIAEAFKKGTAPISDAAREEMRTGMREMPPEIREEMEGAANPVFPPEVLWDFENPIPHVSDEELEMLRQNGLNSGTQ